MDTTTFIKERKYLMNVSEATLQFYEDTSKSVLKHGDFTEEGLKRWVYEFSSDVSVLVFNRNGCTL